MQTPFIYTANMLAMGGRAAQFERFSSAVKTA
jgi:hypothetical protein